MPSLTTRTCSELPPSRALSTSTIEAVPTPRSAGDHRSTLSTTSLGTTSSRLGHLVVLADLDAVAPGGAHDLLPSTFLRRGALELGLVPARHGVPDMRLIVDGQVLFALLVDVGELAGPQAIAALLREGGHRRPPSVGDSWSCV